MNTAFSYGTITEANVKRTRDFAAKCLRDLRKIKTEEEKRDYILKLSRKKNTVEAREVRQS